MTERGYKPERPDWLSKKRYELRGGGPRGMARLVTIKGRLGEQEKWQAQGWGPTRQGVLSNTD